MSASCTASRAASRQRSIRVAVRCRTVRWALRARLISSIAARCDSLMWSSRARGCAAGAPVASLKMKLIFQTHETPDLCAQTPSSRDPRQTSRGCSPASAARYRPPVSTRSDAGGRSSGPGATPGQQAGDAMRSPTPHESDREPRAEPVRRSIGTTRGARAGRDARHSDRARGRRRPTPSGGDGARTIREPASQRLLRGTRIARWDRFRGLRRRPARCACAGLRGSA